MSMPVVVIGYIIVIPSALACMACVIMGILLALGMTENHPGASVVAATVMFSIALALFVSGLLGYLLTMKKWILQCTYCSAVVQAS